MQVYSAVLQYEHSWATVLYYYNIILYQLETMFKNFLGKITKKCHKDHLR